MKDVHAYIHDLTCQGGSWSTNRDISKILLQVAKDVEIFVKGYCSN
jgi:hypothetical protein